MGPAAPVLHAEESLEEAGQCLVRDADSRVADDQFGARRVVPHRDGDLSLEGVLEGIAQQIEDDFFPHAAIDVDGFRQWRAIDNERDPCFFNGGAEAACQVCAVGREVGRLITGLGSPRLDARKVQ